MTRSSPTPERPWIPGLPTRVRLIEQIGVGGTATVWRARDTEVGRDVAVKLIVAEGAGERLEREARSLVRLRGVPGVLVVHELGLSPDGTGWMVCQLARRGSLRDRTEHASLDSDDCIVLGSALSATLAAAHRAEVLHGDVTPGNVLFDDSPSPLLADFGSARLDALSGSARVGFTPAFAAPELVRGAAATAAADVYSLAATLRAACSEPSPGLSELLESCLDPVPAARPTATSLAGSFEALSGRRKRARRR